MPINSNDKTREAQKIWDALSPMISSLVSRSTRSCVRARKMQVMEPADGRFLAVAEPYGNTIRVPYSAALQDVPVGSAVWVIWFFDNASTMIAVATGAGQLIPDYDSVATPFILLPRPTNIPSGWTSALRRPSGGSGKAKTNQRTEPQGDGTLSAPPRRAA